MTDKEQIERISKLLNELHLDDITSSEFDEMFPKQSINDIKDELWRMYCFASDVCDTINMGDTDTTEQEPKIGHWVVWDTSSYDWTYKCDKCGHIALKQSNYCPNCGCKMSKIQTSSESEG